MARLLAILCGFGSTFAGSARAAPWDTTFTSHAVGTHLGGEGLAFIIAAVGDAQSGNQAEADAAAAALAAAARNSGKTRLVMSDDALGSLVGLDDSAIVAKAKLLPVDQVVVLRVFPGGAGGSSTAVVTLYDKASGAVRSAFSATAGVALVAAEGAQTSAGVGSAAAHSVSELTTKAAANQEEAQDKYDKSYLWFGDMAAVDTKSGAVVASWSEPLRGKYKEPITWEKFYETVGRADLAKEHEARKSQKWGLFALAQVGVWGGVILSTWGLSKMSASVIADDIACFELSDRESEDACMAQAQAAADNEQRQQRSEGKPLLLAGGAAALAGGIAWIYSGTIDTQPVTAPEAREMADKHNKRLREDLGMRAAEEQRLRRAAGQQAVTVRVVPVITPTGGGVALSLSF